MTASPFLKWAGGKRRLLPQLEPLLPPGARQRPYIEPFLGGASMFFHLEPKTSLLNDTNAELISVYTAVKEQVEELIESLALLALSNTEASYYAIRERYNTETFSLCDRAALFIFLNRTCFNGLYRVNRDGGFNVPYGKYKRPRIVDCEGLRAASAALASTMLMCKSYSSAALQMGRAEDFIYFDPPYAPLSSTSNFVAYTADGFGSDDQIRLRNVFGQLHERGCKVMISNSDTPELRQLYAGYGLHQIQAARAINAKGNGRGKVSELVVTNYEVRP